MAINIQPNSDQVGLADKKGGIPYMLVVAVSLLAIVTTMFLTQTKTNRTDNLAQVEDCAKEKRELNVENKQLRAEMLSMVLEFNKEKEEYKKNTDSVIRAAVKKKLK